MSIRRAGVAGAGGCNPPRTINTPVLPALQVAQLADSPLGLWKLDETSGLTAADSSGNGRDGTYSHGASGSLAAAAINGNGTASYNANFTGKVTISDAAWMDVNDYTVEGLFYANASKSLYGLIGRNTTTNIWVWVVEATGFQQSEIYNSGGTQYQPASGATGPSTSTPYHYAFKWDSTAHTVKYFINGTLVTTKSSTTSTARVGTADIILGDGGYSTKWPGTLSFCAFYGTALSDARILAHAQAAGVA